MANDSADKIKQRHGSTDGFGLTLIEEERDTDKIDTKIVVKESSSYTNKPKNYLQSGYQTSGSGGNQLMYQSAYEESNSPDLK